MYIFLLGDAAATLTITDADGAEIAAGTTMDPGNECAAAAVAMHFTLEAQNYTVHFGGVASVEAVIHGPIGGEHQHGGGAGGHHHMGGAGGHAEGGHGGEHMGEGGHAEGGHGGEHMGHDQDMGG